MGNLLNTYLYPYINPNEVDLSHFTIHRKLGIGSFGHVYVCEYQYTNTLYAIKRIDIQQLYHYRSAYQSIWIERYIGIHTNEQHISVHHSKTKKHTTVPSTH